MEMLLIGEEFPCWLRQRWNRRGQQEIFAAPTVVILDGRYSIGRLSRLIFTPPEVDRFPLSGLGDIHDE
jgi:hypothetical protein